LGEIEAALREHASVGQAVVSVIGEGAGKRLVGYVAPASGQEAVEEEALRRWLEGRLPEYQIPSAFVTMEKLPVNANGKLDHKALPEPGQEPGAEPSRYVAPRTPAERTLARIWEQVLKREPIGVNENFFRLGGDSILSIQIVARAQQAGLQLTPRQLFQHQTIAELAAASGAGAAGGDFETVEGPVELTPIQQWYFAGERGNLHHYNQAVMLATEGAVDVGAMRAVWERLVEHHDALRMRFAPEQGRWRQWNQRRETEPIFTLVEIDEVEPERQRQMVEEVAGQAQKSLNLERGPVLRVCLMRLAGGGWRLLMVAHHLVIDGVSWRILLEDLEWLYARALAGEALDLPGKTMSYQKWAAGLSERARSAEWEAERSYWESVRAKGRRLPRDGAGEGKGRVETSREALLEFSEEQTRRMLEEGPGRDGSNVQRILLSGIAEAVCRWSGQRGALVDVESHGREATAGGAEVTRTVGWFTTVYPVWLQWGGRMTDGELLGATSRALSAAPRGGIGYGILGYLGETAEGVEGKGCGAEIGFNYLGQLDRVLESGSRWGGAPEQSGESQDVACERSHALEVNAAISGGRLWVRWRYSAELHDRETIEGLAGSFASAVRRLAEATGKQLTPSSQKFRLANLPSDQLRRVIARHTI
jgi:non-ribosomal peptide synthase protein (TIGR01720 family)